MRRLRFQDYYLWRELNWFVRLRWVAGTMVFVGGLAEPWPVSWHHTMGAVKWVGVGIVLYNVILALMLRRGGRRGRRLRLQAWLQILLDLGALTLLVMWTGRLYSPLLGFFIFHMVFASILLTRQTAYAVAGLAVVMMAGGLAGVGQWTWQGDEMAVFVGWAVMLFLTVYLAGHITENLSRQRIRALERSRRIHQMNERLRQQQQAMIQHEKSVALGQMAAGLAHEIANPLANMDSLLQLAGRRQSGLEGQAMDKLRHQIGRIRQIIDQMTRFAHPTEQQWEVCSVADLLEVALAMIRFDRRWKRVRVDSHLHQPCCRLRVQPHAFEQVLVNILINALDAMEARAEPVIEIFTQCQDRFCRIGIRDNGHGIAEKDRGRIFDAFFTTKPVGRGTGLGLSISRELIRNQGGEIEIESTVGKGTTVYLVMPNVQE